MLQRFLYTTLAEGLAAIQKDATLLEDIFNPFDLPVTEIAAIKTLWGSKPPRVKHQYARTDDDFPLYSIVLSNERESNTFIGNDGGMVDGGPYHRSDIKSAVWQHTYQILCYSEHPDHTAYLYEVAKSIFIAAHLEDGGIFGATFSGMDLGPDARYIPENLFARQFTVVAEREFQYVDRDSRLGKAYKVSGIHIHDPSEASEVLGGVVANIDPVEE